jgi:hypothetical protein
MFPAFCVSPFAGGFLMNEWLNKVRFQVTWQGIVNAREFLCFDCADRLGVGPDEDADFEWQSAPACGGRHHKVHVYNKGSDCPAEPGENWECPLCGRLQTGCGAEVSFYLTLVESGEQTFAEVEHACDHYGRQANSPGEDDDYRDWCRERLAESEALRQQMLL